MHKFKIPPNPHYQKMHFFIRQVMKRQTGEGLGGGCNLLVEIARNQPPKDNNVFSVNQSPGMK